MKKILYLLCSLTIFGVFFIGYLAKRNASPEEVKSAFIKEDRTFSAPREEMFLCAMNKNFNPDELVFLGLNGAVNPYVNAVCLCGALLGEMTDIPGDIILFADGKKYVIPPSDISTVPILGFFENDSDVIFSLIRVKWDDFKRGRSKYIYNKYIHNVFFDVSFNDWKHIRQCHEITIKMDKQNAKEVRMNIAVLPELGTYMPKSALPEKHIKLQQKVPFLDVVMGATKEAGGFDYLKKNYDMQVEEIRKKYSSTPPIRIEDKK